MTAPLTALLRSRPESLRIGITGESTMSVRVQVPEVWDVVRVDASPDTPVAVLKARALAALMPDESDPDAFVVKFRGIEVLDEEASIAAVGAFSGSIFLLTGRRRRPVR
jgi:hypothetical protein